MTKKFSVPINKGTSSEPLADDIDNNKIVNHVFLKLRSANKALATTIGCLYILYFSLATIMAIKKIRTLEEEGSYETDNLERDVTVFIISIVFNAAEIITALLLVLGIHCNIRYLLCPWLGLNYIIAGISILTFIGSLVTDIDNWEENILTLAATCLYFSSVSYISKYFKIIGQKKFPILIIRSEPVNINNQV